MTDQELQRLCELWQRRLRLQDWTVKVQIARKRDLDLTDSEGQIQWVLSRREALIKLMDPIDYSPTAMTPQDLEVSLVHELLHLYFAPFDAEDGTLQQTCPEQAIDALSNALVKLARKVGDDDAKNAS